MLKIKLIYKDSNFEIWGSDSILAINNTKKEYGKYAIDLKQIRLILAEKNIETKKGSKNV